MAFEEASLFKSVSSLPATLTPDSIYFVRVLTGYDLYVTSKAGGGVVAFLMNKRAAGNEEDVQFNSGGLLAGAGKVAIDQNVLLLRSSTAAENISYAPVAGGILVYSRQRTGRDVPFVVSPKDEEYALQASLADKVIRANSAIGFGTVNMSAFNMNTWSRTGTNDTYNIADTQWGATPKTGTSPSVLTNYSGFYSPQVCCIRGSSANSGGFYAKFIGGIDDNITGLRTQMGLTSSVAAVSDQDPSLMVNQFSVIQDPTLNGGTNWHFCVTGTVAPALTVNTGISVAQAVLYDFQVYCPPLSTLVYMSLRRLSDNAYVEYIADLSTLPANRYPAANVGLAPRVWRSGDFNSNVVFSHFYMETQR